MFFKNLQVYRFTRPLEHDENALERNLEEFKFKALRKPRCLKVRLGISDGENRQSAFYPHSQYKQILICLKKEEKMLPAGVIKDQLNERVEAIEALNKAVH